ncbi:MAG: multiple ligand-binding protein 1 [Bacteroidia bacterium]
MKTLKISIIALLMLVGNVILAQEGPKKTAEQRATDQSKRLTTELGLNADQQKSAYTLALQHAQQQDADRAKNKDDKEAMKTARKQNRDNFDAGLAKILTADQNTKYKQLAENDKAKHKQGGGQ